MTKSFPDLNDDGKPDLVWTNSATGKSQVWYMNEVTKTGTASLPCRTNLDWRIVGIADFNNDGKPDLL